MINKYKIWLEDKANYSNKNYDKEGFPEVDRTYMQYSKASRDTLKQLAAKYKLDNRGSKKALLSRIMTKFSGAKKVQGYYNRVGDDKFQYMQKDKK